MKTEKILLGVAIIIAVFSLISIEWDILSQRALRLLTSVVFFLLALKIVGLKKPLGLLIFGLLIACDYFLLEWEAIPSKLAYYSIHSLIILSLILLTLKDMEWRKISFFEIGSAVFFLIANSYVFFLLKEYFIVEGALLKILFNINGFLIVMLVVLSYFYSINRPNILASSFFLGVLGWIVSDLMLFADYYLGVSTFLYIDNFFYVVGFFFLLQASLKNKKMEEMELIQKENKEKEKAQNFVYK